MNILFFNMSNFSDWQAGIVNRNFFVLKNLQNHPRVGKVLAVDFLPLRAASPFGWKRTAKYFSENILASPAGQLIWQSSASRCRQIKPDFYLYSSVGQFFSPEKVWRELRTLTEKLLGEDIVIWCYNPFLIEAFQKISGRLKVFDMVDNWAAHASYSSHQQQLNQAYPQVKRSAQVIFTVAEELKKLYQDHPNCHWIPNGVEIEHFSKKNPAPADIAGLSRPIIGYVGTIQEKVDFDLVRFLAARHLDKSFVLVGPVWKSVEHELNTKLSHLENVIFLGRKSYQEMPAYLQQFDLAIIPHKTNSFIKSTNPMKMYEYLAAGKPIVSTAGAGMAMFPQWVAVANTPEEFSQQIFLLLAEDSPAKREARVVAVKEHSWQSRVEQMLGIIQKGF